MIKSIVELIKGYLEENLYKIYLYGSRAKGNFTESSDYDLFIVLYNIDKKDADYLKIDLKLMIESLFDVKADIFIRDLKTYENKKEDKGSLVGQVVDTGVVIYESKA